MSADNWAVCARCVADHTAELERLRKEAEDSYGKVSAEEYHRRLDSIPYARSPDYRQFQTFREDYEIMGAEEGVVRVSYVGSCTNCGTSLTFTDEHPIPRHEEPKS